MWSRSRRIRHLCTEQEPEPAGTFYSEALRQSNSQDAFTEPNSELARLHEREDT